MLTDKQIQEFKAIYEKETGKEITDAEASEYAYRLINVIKLVYSDEVKPGTQDKTPPSPGSV